MMTKALFRLRTASPALFIARSTGNYSAAGLHTSARQQNGGHISPLKAFADSVRRQ
ncbi:hypothetical protein LPJ66_003482, partial [Kickxella alabastrina]